MTAQPPPLPLRRLARRSAAAACLSLLLAVRAAHADPEAAGAPPSDSAFTAHYQQAHAAYEDGRYHDAVDALLAAYALRAEPRILFNIAQAYRKVGDAALARRYFESYLDADKGISSEKKIEVESYLRELAAPAERLRTAPSAAVAVLAQPMRADIPVAVAVADAGRTAGLPRWSKGLGALFIAGGAGLIASGATFLALDGQCTHDPVPPMVQCRHIYQTTAAGAAQVGAAGALWVSGVLTLVVPLARSRSAASSAGSNRTRVALRMD